MDFYVSTDIGDILVQPEQITSARVLNASAVHAATVECKRYRNGKWVTYVDLEVVTKLPDGRKIHGTQKVSVQCSQEGRKDGR